MTSSRLKRFARLRVPSWGRLLAVVACCAFVGCSKPSPAVSPPNVALDTLDPSLADLIRRSRQAVVTAPQSPDAWGKLGQALHAAEFFPQAQSCYRQAAALDGTSPRWPHLLGLVQLQETPEEGIHQLTRAATLAGPQPDAPTVRLAQALVERGRYTEADRYIQSLLTRDPFHPAARLESARVLLAANETERAAEVLGPCLTNAFTHRPALLLLAQARQRMGDVASATEIARRATTLPRPFDWPDPFLREVLSLRADRRELAAQINSLLVQQRFPEAEAALNRLLNGSPHDPEGLLLLGRLRYQQRQCAEAAAVLRRHLEVQPQSVNGLVQLASALLCDKHWPEAIATLQQAIALKPDFAQAHYNLGFALARIGDSPGAIRSFREALRASPGDVPTHLALAEELALAGHRADAAVHLDRAAALAPNDPRVQRLRERLAARPGG